MLILVCNLFFFFSSRRRHTRCALVTGVQTCALPIASRKPTPIVWRPRGSARSVGCSDSTLARFSFHIAEAARRPRPASGAIECALLTLRDPPGGAVPDFGSLDTKPPQR